MPHIPVHPSAIKRQRQNLKRRARNRMDRARVRGAVKQANDTIGGNDKVAATAALRDAMSQLHKAAAKKTLHRNTAARKVAQLSAKLHKIHGGAKASPSA